MPEPVGHGLRVDPGHDELGGEGVPQAVQAALPAAYAERPDERPEQLVGVSRHHERAVDVADDEDVVRERDAGVAAAGLLLRPSALQPLHEPVRDGQRPHAGRALRPLEVAVGGGQGADGAGDAHHAAVEIDVRPAQGADLPASEAREQGEPHYRVERAADAREGGEQRVLLFGGERAGKRAVVLGRADPAQVERGPEHSEAGELQGVPDRPEHMVHGLGAVPVLDERVDVELHVLGGDPVHGDLPQVAQEPDVAAIAGMRRLLDGADGERMVDVVPPELADRGHAALRRLDGFGPPLVFRVAGEVVEVFGR